MADFFGSGLSQQKQKSGFDAAASERERIKAASEAMHKAEKMRANQMLLEAKRKRDRNAQDISEREREIRRLTMEIAHTGSELRLIEQESRTFDTKDTNLKEKVAEHQSFLQRMQKETFERKRESEAHVAQVTHLEHQIAELQHKLSGEKAALFEINTKMQKLDLEIRHAEGAMHKDAGDADRTKSQETYKKKEAENKKKSVAALEQKKTAQEGEMLRLKTEQDKLEREIQELEAKVR